MSDIETINYAPLEAESKAFSIIFKQYRLYTVGVAVVAIGVCWLQFEAGIALFILWLFVLNARAQRLKNTLWESFAVANGWPLDAVANPATLLPMSLDYGHSQTFTDAITANIGDISADMVVYSTTIGEGKREKTFFFTVARVTLPKSLPHILLRAKKDRSELAPDFADYEPLTLEGDFSDYFTLQVEKGQEVNALEILTPDVMQTLVSYSQHEDVEILVDNLYFIVAGDARSEVSIRQLIDSVDRLSSQIIEHVEQTSVSEPENAPLAA